MDIRETLMILRNIFYKCFFVGFIFLALAALLYMPCRCYVANFYQTYLGIGTVAYYNMWVSFIGLIKTILIFLFLVPGLSVHWVIYEYDIKNKPSE